MVLGYVDHDEAGHEVGVWYSADGAVLRLRDGRLVGLTGSPVEWRSIQLPSDLPTWQDTKVPYRYTRVRDQMPGYQLGVKDDMHIRMVSAPASKNVALKGLDASTLTWFEESEAHHQVQPALVATQSVDNKTQAVYGQQCLTDKFCLSWQAWPVGQGL